MDFCHHYHLQFFHPSSATVYYYITPLTRQFKSTKACTTTSQGSGSSTSSWDWPLSPRYSELWTSLCGPHPSGACQSCQIPCCACCPHHQFRAPGASHVGLPGFLFFVMPRQNNLTPTSQGKFNPSLYTLQPSHTRYIYRWSNMLQSVGRAPSLLILEVPG